jgi:hypothetical protein
LRCKQVATGGQQDIVGKPWFLQQRVTIAHSFCQAVQSTGSSRTESGEHRSFPPSVCKAENGDINPVEWHFSRFLRLISHFAQRLSKRALSRKRIRKHLRADSWFTGFKQGTSPKG